MEKPAGGVKPTSGRSCRSCGAGDVSGVYETSGVPLHSCLLLDDREEARTFATGDIELLLCRVCGLIQNHLFDPSLMRYASDYEDSQAHSERFIQFATEVIEHLDYRYDLAGGNIVEIGCGKGDFLVLMSNQLGATGLGIDPAYRPGPLVPEDPSRVRFVTEAFTPRSDIGEPDLIVCRHTLEHLPDVREFVSGIRDAIGERDIPVFFEVPESARILSERAFWDVYYEHCSYFVESSIRNLFEICGFEVLETWLGMEDQYLMLTARPATRTHRPERTLGLEDRSASFRSDVADKVGALRRDLDAASTENGTVVLWGASSKAVSYLHALDVKDEVAAVVDINPVKWGKYLAGSGMPIVGPDDLTEIQPDTVIVMNPAYRDEIGTDLEKRDIPAVVLAL